jgi:hypothetical protein
MPGSTALLKLGWRRKYFALTTVTIVHVIYLDVGPLRASENLHFSPFELTLEAKI